MTIRYLNFIKKMYNSAKEEVLFLYRVLHKLHF